MRAMPSRWLVLFAIAGCSFTHGQSVGGGSGDGRPADTHVFLDAPPDAYDAMCFGPKAYEVCLPGAPTGTMTLSGNLDTSGNEGDSCANTGHVMKMSTPAQTLACVVAADTLQVLVGTTASATGDNPLVLLGGSGVTIAGTLDVSSRARTTRQTAANANATTCGSNLTGTDNSQGGGGGAGGSFGTIGGSGSIGNAGGGGAGGQAAAAAAPTKLVGGCKGGDGGAGGTGGTGADSGGAVEIVSHMSLTISGAVNASGAGGDGGSNQKAGGGGGGSGGMIVLDAQTYIVTGSVFADGGGGGGGGSQNTAGTGGDDATMLGMVANGGPGAAGAGATGGAGAYSNIGAVSPSNAPGGGGGGGGGGGAGIIHIFGGSFPTSQASPPPS
jgi:hypothetical protein